MPVRPEMQALINYMRQYGAAATDDVFQGVTFWSDVQLQDILDQHASSADVLLRQYTPTVFALTCPRHVQMPSNITVVDADGNDIAYSEYNPMLAEITFATDQADPLLFARGLKVNLWEALAALWDAKANQRFDYNNFKAGNNRIDIRQEYEACIRNRDHYRSRTIRRFPRLSGRWTTR